MSSWIGITCSWTQSCRCTQSKLHTNQNDLLCLTNTYIVLIGLGAWVLELILRYLEWFVDSHGRWIGGCCIHITTKQETRANVSHWSIPLFKDNEVLFAYIATQDTSVMNSVFLFLKQIQLSKHLASLSSYMKSKVLTCLHLYISVQVHFMLWNWSTHFSRLHFFSDW